MKLTLKNFSLYLEEGETISLFSEYIYYKNRREQRKILNDIEWATKKLEKIVVDYELILFEKVNFPEWIIKEIENKYSKKFDILVKQYNQRKPLIKINDNYWGLIYTKKGLNENN